MILIALAWSALGLLLLMTAVAYCDNRKFGDGRPFAETFLDTPSWSAIPIRFLHAIVSHWVPPDRNGPFLYVPRLLPQWQLLSQSWRRMREEALAVSARQMQSFDEVDPTQKRIVGATGAAWGTYVFKFYKDWFEPHMQECAFTAQVLRSLGPRLRLAMFSRLEEGAHIPAHRGPWRGGVRLHLPLLVPPGGAKIRVQGRVHEWREGQLVAFDDTYVHEVWNSDGPRIVLFMDIEREEIPPWLHALAETAGAWYTGVINRNVRL